MMKDIYRRRLERLKAVLARDFDNNLAALGRKIGRADAYLWQLLHGRRNIGEQLARDVERSLGLPPYSLDAHGYSLPDERWQLVDCLDAIEGGRIVARLMSLSKDWLVRQLPAMSAPQNLSLMVVGDNAMQPTMSEGDLLLIDRAVSKPQRDGVYALVLDAEPVARRLQKRPDGALIVRCDNGLYEPIVLSPNAAASLRVLGQALWVWTGRPL